MPQSRMSVGTGVGYRAEGRGQRAVQPEVARLVDPSRVLAHCPVRELSDDVETAGVPGVLLQQVQ